MESQRVEDTPAPARSASDPASNPVTADGLSPWIWAPEALFSTPSRMHSQPMDWRQESYDRCLGIHWLTRVGMNMHQPQLSIATAAVYFHRFYMRHPLQQYPWKAISATALFLAIKVEEVPRKLEHLVREYLILDGMKPEDEGGPPMHRTQEFVDLHQDVLFYEDVVLRMLAYDLIVEHPYASMIRTIRFLHHPRTHNPDRRSRPGTPSSSGSAGPRYKASRVLAKTLSRHAWGFVNDSLSTPLCVIRTPQTIAAAAYLLALKQSQCRVPDEYADDGEDPPTARTGAHKASDRRPNGDVKLEDDRPSGVKAEDDQPRAAKAEDEKPSIMLEDNGPAKAVAAKDFATGASGNAVDVAEAHARSKFEVTAKLPPGLVGRSLGAGERITWWEAFGATSLKDVQEAANIMLDQYARSAAEYIRDNANSIRRPPHPSPLEREPFTTSWTPKKEDGHQPSPVPALPAEPASQTPAIVPPRDLPSMYSPKPRRPSPKPDAASPMGGGEPKRFKSDLANGHPASSPAPRYERRNLPSPFLDEPEDWSGSAAAGEPHPSTGTDGMQWTPGVAASQSTEDRMSGIDKADREGEAMKEREEALRVEEENRREEARLAALRPEDGWPTLPPPTREWAR